MTIMDTPMTGSRTFASLAPVLLARKGGARPATRAGLDDFANDQDAGELDQRLFEAPEIKRQQERLLHSIADANDRAAAKVTQLHPVSDRRRAAFTLRLDAERHLRLKLAATVAGTSAQALLTEALDAMLADMPEIESLAAQVRRGPDQS